MSRPPRCPRTRLRQPQQHMGTVNPTSARHLGHTVGILMRLLEANCLFLHWLPSNFSTREFCTGFGRGCGFWPRQKPHSPKHRWGRRRDSGPWSQRSSFLLSLYPRSDASLNPESLSPAISWHTRVWLRWVQDKCAQQVCLVGSLTVCKASGTNARQNFGGLRKATHGRERGPVNLRSILFSKRMPGCSFSKLQYI